MIEIGRAKRATQVYGFDDIAIVPTRRTRTPEDVKLTWTIDALTFDFPIVAAPMDSVMSPATAIAFGKPVPGHARSVAGDAGLHFHRLGFDLDP